MNERQRVTLLAGVPIFAGSSWLWAGAHAGFLPFLLMLPVGGALLASGAALGLWAGDRRFAQIMALAGLVGVLAVPLLAVGLGLGSALWLAGLAGAAAASAASAAVSEAPEIEGVPHPEPGPRLLAGVALDQMVLGMEQFATRLPTGDAAQRMVEEAHAAVDLYRGRGWLADPRAYHLDPPALVEPRIESARSGRIAYEHLRFESLYEPHDGEPGRDRWLAHGPPRTAHAYLLRRDTADRPWLVCTNGYRMGLAGIDLRAFGHYHEILGLNVLIPVLPLHGPRRIGRHSGDGFLAGNVLDTLHGEAQAIWDIRRLIGWLRGQGASAVGILGLSLGGYTTALLASIESGLACAVAGIPVADLTRLFWYHGSPRPLEDLERLGIDQALVRELMTVVSPLALEPQVPFEARLIFGGNADQLVPPDHIRDLAAHWGLPEAVWYSSGHLGFRMDRRVQDAVDALLRKVKLCP
jgi:dienelactone hydrolase